MTEFFEMVKQLKEEEKKMLGLEDYVGKEVAVTLLPGVESVVSGDTTGLLKAVTPSGLVLGTTNTSAVGVAEVTDVFVLNNAIATVKFAVV